MQNKVILANQVVTIDVPNSFGDLTARYNQLHTDLAAVKQRMAMQCTTPQYRSLKREMYAIEAELKLVNRKLQAFKPKKSVKERFKERQQILKERHLAPFPDQGTDQDRYEWAVGWLNYAIDVLKENEIYGDRWQNLCHAMAACQHWEKQHIVDAVEAERLYNRTHKEVI